MRFLNLKHREWSPPARSPAATFSSARRGPRPRSTVAGGGGARCARRPSAPTAWPRFGRHPSRQISSVCPAAASSPSPAEPPGVAHDSGRLQATAASSPRHRSWLRRRISRRRRFHLTRRPSAQAWQRPVPARTCAETANPCAALYASRW
jgi:hypothetical protein